MPLQDDFDGLFNTRYRAFLETVTHIRADLHRYCARMTGSVLFGEDVMQETLFEAYRKIETLEEPHALRAWIFRIAHNRCIDFLRSRDARERAEFDFVESEELASAEEPGEWDAGPTLERLVTGLPPRERACVLLKDVFDYSHQEVADLVASTVGAVKAALHRGRTRLAALRDEPLTTATRNWDPQVIRLLERYVELFNQRDWDGVRALTSADARLRVADCFRGRLADSPYFVEYARSEVAWDMQVGELDGEPVVIVSNRRFGRWEPAHVVWVHVAGDLIDEIADYYACPWLLPAAQSAGVVHSH